MPTEDELKQLRELNRFSLEKPAKKLVKTIEEALPRDRGADQKEQQPKEYEIYKEQDQKITSEPIPEPTPQPEEDWVIVDEDDEREREVEAYLDRIETLASGISSPEHFKKEAAMEEIRKLKTFLKANNKDDTITYF